MAALFNSLKIVGKPIEDLRVLVVGLGAAGVAVTKMMLASGVTHMIGCDRHGALSDRARRLRVGRDERDQALVRRELQPRPARRALRPT